MSKGDIKILLDSQTHRCMSTRVGINQHNKSELASLTYVECSHYNVLLTTNLYFDKGFDSYKANNILSHTHDRKTLSSILKHPITSSIYKDQTKNSDAIIINFMNQNNFKALMKSIYKQRMPYSMSTTEYLKILDNKKGMLITQQVDVNFLKFNDAYNFLENVTENYYYTPLSSLNITN